MIFFCFLDKKSCIIDEISGFCKAFVFAIKDIIHPYRKTGLFTFDNRNGNYAIDIHKSMQKNKQEGYEYLNKTDELEKKFGKFMSNLHEIEGVFDPEAGILWADRCLSSIWVRYKASV